MPVKRLLNEMDSLEIAEWMAYEQTNSKEWVDKFNYEKELAKSAQMSAKEQAKAFKRLFGGV